MNHDESLARRFIALPLEKRKLFLRSLKQEAVDFGVFPIPAGVDVPARYRASYAQQRMWLLWQLNPQSGAYNLPGALRLAGKLDVAALEQAFTALVTRHESLRTVFYQQGEEVWQRILAQAPLSIAIDDLSALSPEQREVQVLEKITAESLLAFDLERGPLLRLKLFRLAADEHILQITVHHIAGDGWSINIVMAELPHLYNGFCRGNAPQLPALPVQYSDYALWQRSFLEAGELEHQLQYWTAMLGDDHSPLPLPLDRPRTSTPSFRGASIDFVIEKRLANGIRALAKSAGATLFMTMLGAFGVLLARYSGRREIRIGVPVANRNRVETEGLIGFFVNTQVMCFDVDGANSFALLLAQIKQRAIDAQAAQDVPFEQLVERLQPQRNLSHNPLFQVKFNQHVNADDGDAVSFKKLQLDGLRVDGVDVPIASTYFDLALDIADGADGIAATLAYPVDLFDRDSVAHLSSQLLHVLEWITGNVQLPLAAIQFVGANTLPVPTQPLLAHGILQSFSQMVACYGEKTALQSDHVTLSYTQLDTASDELALTLIEQGVDIETPVAVCLERGIDAVVAMLAIMKAGGCYVPLDIRLPPQRLVQIIENLVFGVTENEIKIVIANTVIRPALLQVASKPDDIRFVPGDALAAVDSTAVACRAEQIATLADRIRTVAGDQAAYVIYTSGSTGQPKGVVVSHRNLANYVQALLSRFEFAAGASMAMVSGIAADLGHTVLFGALCSGRSLHLLPEHTVADADRFAHYMREHQVGILKIVPGHLAGLLTAAAQGASCAIDVLPEHALILGGDRCDWPLVEKIHGLKPQCRLINHYGPTETTVGVLALDITPQLRASCDAITMTAPLGTALANIQVYVLDADLNRVPAKVEGELYIGGAGVARGYLAQSALTAERFVPNPFTDEIIGDNAGRLYRTGDRVRYDRLGRIEFLGRRDEQVKIRGYRVEPSETLLAIRNIDGIADAAVLPLSSGEEARVELVAWCVLHDSSDANATRAAPEKIRAALQQKLPDYLVPAHIVVLPALPRTANGKLDKRALSQPADKKTLYVAPRTDAEKILTDIWQAVLKVEKVGIHDNFFDLGGDSIRSLMIIARARKQGMSFEPKQLFEKQTIAQLLERETAQTDEQRAAIVSPQTTAIGWELLEKWQQQLVGLPKGAHRAEQVMPLSPMQQAMLFHSLYEPQSDAYVNQIRVDISGLDVARFSDAWQQTIDAHDSLRVSALWQNDLNLPVQIVNDVALLALTVHDWRAHENPVAALDQLAQQQRHRGFALDSAPLMRIVLAQTGPDQHHMIFTHHHLLMDGWSQSLLWDEVLRRYEGVAITPRTVGYRDYVAWLLARQAQQQQQKSLQFWRDELAPLSAPVRLADADISVAASRDEEVTATETPHYGESFVRLATQATAGLQNFARQQKVTVNTVLQATWILLLQRYSGQQTVVFGVTVAGRPADLPGIEQQLGLFINTLPIVTSPSPQLTVAQWLQQLQHKNLALREHEHIPLYQIQSLASAAKSIGDALFDNILVFENYPLTAALQQKGSNSTRFSGVRSEGHTSFALTIEARVGEELVLGFSYARTQFSDAFIRRLGRHLEHLLLQMSDAAAKPLGQLALLDGYETTQTVSAFNNTDTPFPEHSCLHQLIEQQVLRTPNAAALIVADMRFSYTELNAHANQLAHYLRAQGIGADSIVGVAMYRSVEMVVALLGILKAGAAYVPVDPDYPAERVRYMIEDSAITLLLTQQAVLDAAQQQTSVQVLCLDREAALLSRGDAENPVNIVAPQNLAYLLYTSGSTGKPKGAAISHAAIVNRLHWMQQHYRLTASDRVLQKTPFSFDVSVWEFFWPLMTGAALVVAAPGAHQDPLQLRRVIVKESITTLHFVPSMLQAFVSAGELEHCTSLQRVICSGEALSWDLQQKFLAARPMHQRVASPAELHNLYGPTEAAVDVTSWQCGMEPANTRVPIGRPIANIRLHILDHNLDPVPVGIAGELYIGGVGLARGYHRRAGLTAERFVPDVFATQPGARLYRTGDLARYRHDGVIDYLGRIDHQVKIHGLRIELSEIENQLLAHGDISEACVLAVARNGSVDLGLQLVAYVVPTDESRPGSDAEPLVAALKRHLLAVLPEYMLPQRFMLLDAMPLNANGKLDRKQLPAIDFTGNPYIAPRSDVERQLVDIWQALLQCEPIGVADDFFERGGNSLLAIQLLSRIRAVFAVEFPLRDLFALNTIERLAQALTVNATSTQKLDDDIDLMAQLLDEVES